MTLAPDVLEELDFPIEWSPPETTTKEKTDWDAMRREMYGWHPAYQDNPVYGRVETVADREDRERREAAQQAREREAAARRWREQEDLELAQLAMMMNMSVNDLRVLPSSEVEMLRAQQRYYDYQGRSHYCYCSPSRGALFRSPMMWGTQHAELIFRYAARLRD